MLESEYGKTQARTVICDWGSSRLRAFFITSDGKVANRYESDRGVKFLGGRDEAFRDELSKALLQLGVDAGVPIRISGMAGAKNGWVETNYASTPAGCRDFSTNHVSLPGFENARLYGGLKHQRSDGSIDVMRGEEIQVFGVLARHPEAKLICLPGTHSKWVTVQEGRITGFKTYMTGDLFHSLCELSIFAGQIGSREFDRAGFLHGCRLAGEGNDLNDLFRLRTEYVFGNISETGFSSCLSGFLIANELKAEAVNRPVHLCGSTGLMESYALALEEITVESLPVESDAATLRGHLEMML
jgi:2-dehydro-3-deoxygalactonokinase